MDGLLQGEVEPAAVLTEVSGDFDDVVGVGRGGGAGEVGIEGRVAARRNGADGGRKGPRQRECGACDGDRRYLHVLGGGGSVVGGGGGGEQGVRRVHASRAGARGELRLRLAAAAGKAEQNHRRDREQGK